MTRIILAAMLGLMSTPQKPADSSFPFVIVNKADTKTLVICKSIDHDMRVADCTIQPNVTTDELMGTIMKSMVELQAERDELKKQNRYLLDYIRTHVPSAK